MNDQAIKEFLRVNVPLEIQAVLDRGGVNDQDWAWMQQETNNDPKDYRPLNILMSADEYLLYPSSIEKLEIGLKVFRKTITIMSFISGGVRLFGLRFSPKIDGFVEDGCS